MFRKFKKCFILMICLDNQTHNCHKLQVCFVEPRSPSKNFRLQKTIHLQSFFNPCMGFVTVQIFQKMLLLLISLTFQTFNSQPLQIRFLQLRSQLETQHPKMSIQLKNHCFSPFPITANLLSSF